MVTIRLMYMLPNSTQGGTEDMHKVQSCLLIITKTENHFSNFQTNLVLSNY